MWWRTKHYAALGSTMVFCAAHYAPELDELDKTKTKTPQNPPAKSMQNNLDGRAGLNLSHVFINSREAALRGVNIFAQHLNVDQTIVKLLRAGFLFSSHVLRLKESAQGAVAPADDAGCILEHFRKNVGSDCSRLHSEADESCLVQRGREPANFCVVQRLNFPRYEQDIGTYSFLEGICEMGPFSQSEKSLKRKFVVSGPRETTASSVSYGGVHKERKEYKQHCTTLAQFGCGQHKNIDDIQTRNIAGPSVQDAVEDRWGEMVAMKAQHMQGFPPQDFPYQGNGDIDFIDQFDPTVDCACTQFPQIQGRYTSQNDRE
ncbi:hypothetical protein B0H13DRAFT_1887139 [Mycena leptocephala]|nr:hypothetical protein B0H13DRAFT_1887139 [Mycena leptocephala]